MTGATSTGTPSQPQTTQVAPPWRPLKSSGRGGAWGCGEGSRTSPLPVAYLPLPRRGPCWLYPTGPGKGRRAFGRLPPWPPGLGDPGSARAGVPAARRPQSGCGCRCAYLHGVAGHVLAPPARGPRAEGGVAGKARVRPARSVKGGKGAGTAGPRPGARPLGLLHSGPA